MDKDKLIKELAILIDETHSICNRVYGINSCDNCELLNEKRECTFGEYLSNEIYESIISEVRIDGEEDKNE